MDLFKKFLKNFDNDSNFQKIKVTDEELSNKLKISNDTSVYKVLVDDEGKIGADGSNEIYMFKKDTSVYFFIINGSGSIEEEFFIPQAEEIKNLLGYWFEKNNIQPAEEEE